MQPSAAGLNVRHAIRDARPHVASLARDEGRESREGQAGASSGAEDTAECAAGAAGDRPRIRVETLEGVSFVVEFGPPRGWSVLPEEAGPGTEGSGACSITGLVDKPFESLHALLSTASPLYCASFQRAVVEKLRDLGPSTSSLVEEKD